MRQRTRTGLERSGKTKRQAQHLAEMMRFMPWEELVPATEPLYPKGGGTAGGQPLVPLEPLLRIHLLHLWFNLPCPAAEDGAYGSAAICGFVRIDSSRDFAPGASAICKFRHLLERQALGKRPPENKKGRICAKTI